MTTYTCNRCGRYREALQSLNGVGELKDFDMMTNFFHDFKAFFGYGSPFDTSELKFVLCELCIFEVIKTFKIPPKVQEHEVGEDIEPVDFKPEHYEPYLTKEVPYYKDFFIKQYEEIRNLPKK